MTLPFIVNLYPGVHIWINIKKEPLKIRNFWNITMALIDTFVGKMGNADGNDMCLIMDDNVFDCNLFQVWKSIFYHDILLFVGVIFNKIVH